MRCRYPIYVPSKGRYDTCYTAKMFLRDGTDFSLVVEPSEAQLYKDRFPTVPLLVMPRNDMKLVGARNWIRDHSIAAGFDRHWQLDDNIRTCRRLYKGKRIPCNSSIALSVCEQFTDRYTNIGVSGLSYYMFVFNHERQPFWHNCHVYSCSLINNRMPYKWRLVYNDDTDLCLQVLSGGLCTIALNTFMITKIKTMQVRGGNTDQLYQGDGRLRMSRTLERRWPYVVQTERRFSRPQHVVRGNWKAFDTPLIRRTDIDWEALENTSDEMGIKLIQVAPEVQSADLTKLLTESNDDG